MQPPPQTEGTDVAIAVFMVDCRMSHDINQDEERLFTHNIFFFRTGNWSKMLCGPESGLNQCQ